MGPGLLGRDASPAAPLVLRGAVKTVAHEWHRHDKAEGKHHVHAISNTTRGPQKTDDLKKNILPVRSIKTTTSTTCCPVMSQTAF